MLTFRGPSGMLVLRTSRGCNGFRFHPLRPNFNVAINGTLHQVLLSSLRKCTVGAVHVTNIRRRFTSISKMGRSIAGVVLGLGRIQFGGVMRRFRGRGIDVAIRGSARFGTNSVGGCLAKFRILGPRLIVYRLSTGTAVRVRLSVGGNHKCIPTSRGHVFYASIGMVPVSSVCAPVEGMGCTIRGCHMRRGASCRGLILRVSASNSVRPGSTLGRTTGVLVCRFVLFSSRGVALRGSSDSTGRRFSRRMLRVHRLLGAGLISVSLSIHTLGYLGTTSIRALNSLMRFGGASLLGFEGFNGGSLARLSSLLRDLGLSFKASVSGCGLSGSWGGVERGGGFGRLDHATSRERTVLTGVTVSLVVRGEVAAAITGTGTLGGCMRPLVAGSGSSAAGSHHIMFDCLRGGCTVARLFGRVSIGMNSHPNNCAHVVGANFHRNSGTRVYFVRLMSCGRGVTGRTAGGAHAHHSGGTTAGTRRTIIRAPTARTPTRTPTDTRWFCYCGEEGPSVGVNNFFVSLPPDVFKSR